MAALLVVGALVIADKVEKRIEKKRQKKADTEKRYRELQLETNQRIARRESGNLIDTFVDEPQDSSEDETGNVNEVRDSREPPAYQDVVQVGERREREWAMQMQRRRSSVYSQGSSVNGAQKGRDSYMRMG